MSDFPEKIWVTHKEEFPGHVSFRASNLDHSNSPDGTYPEYIRADLVPQWRPIETLDTNDEVILLRDNGAVEGGSMATFLGEKSIKSWFGHSFMESFTHWMPTPKVPE